LEKSNVTLNYFGCRPIETLVDSKRGNPDVIHYQKYPFSWEIWTSI